MGGDVFIPVLDPIQLMPLDGLTDRLVALLDLPDHDPEVRDIADVVRSALATAMQTDRPEVLGDALCFAQERLVVRGLPETGLGDLAATLLTAAGPSLTTAQREHVTDLLGRSVMEPVAVPPHGRLTLGPPSAAYLEHLLMGDREAAIAVTRRCATEGMDVFEILVDVLEPAQYEVGRRWARGDISIAQEHFCTAVTELAMTDLYPGMFSGEVSERRLLAVQAPGSLHHIGLRMVTDVLECRGWSTSYIGEQIVIDLLPALLVEERADLLLVSASMPSQIPIVAAMVRAIRLDPLTRAVKVVVGGRPFLVAPDLVAAVGADGWARDARSAVAVCNDLVGGNDGQ